MRKPPATAAMLAPAGLAWVPGGVPADAPDRVLGG